MSWSVNCIGKAPAVAKVLEEQLHKYPLAEPEETVRRNVASAIAAALAAFPPASVVKVEASGSQQGGQSDPVSNATYFINQLSVSISPVYGFVEDFIPSGGTKP